MFGYVRPFKPELKVLEFEQYKACYCALCHCLGENYGQFSRVFLSYDFVFLAMLLWPADEPVQFLRETCITSPIKKHGSCARNKVLELCAGYSVILTYWKLKDSVSDDSPGKAMLSGTSAAFLKSAYKKAAQKHAAFDEQVRLYLAELSELEKANECSIDRTADKFANILSSAALETDNANAARALSQLLYHTGRWIYIADAVNDIKKDCESSSYNPIAAKNGITDGILSDELKSQLGLTLNHSINSISSAFGLLEKNAWHGILENIIYLGMPEVTRRVLAGEYEDIDFRPQKKDKWENI